MNVLVVGAGVVGTVYGAQLAKDGHTVDVLAHDTRTSQIDRVGLQARDITAGGALEEVTVTVVADTSARSYDLVLVAVWADQIPTVCDFLRSLSGSPLALFFGNNPAGRHGLPGDLAGTAHLGFPGIGGTLQGDIVEYMRIPQQPTTLGEGGGSAVAAFEATVVEGDPRADHMRRLLTLA